MHGIRPAHALPPLHILPPDAVPSSHLFPPNTAPSSTAPAGGCRHRAACPSRRRPFQPLPLPPSPFPTSAARRAAAAAAAVDCIWMFCDSLHVVAHDLDYSCCAQLHVSARLTGGSQLRQKDFHFLRTPMNRAMHSCLYPC
jgi:hypothetical protein